jgi:hypothetical protein
MAHLRWPHDKLTGRAAFDSVGLAASHRRRRVSCLKACFNPCICW